MKNNISDEDLLVEIRANFLTAEEAEADVRADALDCWKFRAGEQWDPRVERKRKASGRPCYVINRVPQFLRQVGNEQKQSRPAIEIDPLGDGADKETAEIVQGLARHAELVSDADDAYDLAFDHMLTGGFGYFRLRTDYVTSRSFDQDVIFEPIYNPFSVYLDPRAKRRDRRDGQWGFLISEMSAAEFAEQHPDSTLANLGDFSSVGDNAGWVLRDSIRVAEYYRVTKQKRTLCKLRDGSVCFFEDVEAGQIVIAKRDAEVNKITWYKTNGVEILDRTDVPGDFIPIIPVLGEEFTVEGRRYLVGLVQWLREPQRLYNLWQSAMAETIALVPKAPFRATVKQIEGFEDIWETANDETYSVLTYNADPNAGGPPARDYGEPPIEAIQSALAHADQDLKNTTGLFDPSLGAPGPEQSGKAILLRQNQGNQANYNFLEAMEPAIQHAARVFIGWVKSVYDTPRVVRIVRPDGSQETVPINQWFKDGALAKIYDLSVGEYDIAVRKGGSFESRRQQAAESMLALVQSNPALMQIVGDLLVKQFDWPFADEIAERLKKMLPTQLQDSPDGEEPVPVAAQQKIAAQSDMLQKLTAAVHQMSAKLEAQQVKAASDERIALIRAKASILEAALKAKSQEAMMIFEKDLEQIDRQIALLPDPALGQEAGPASAAPSPAASAPRPAPATPIPTAPSVAPSAPGVTPPMVSA